MSIMHDRKRVRASVIVCIVLLSAIYPILTFADPSKAELWWEMEDTNDENDLKYAHVTPGVDEVLTLYTGGNVGLYTSIAIDSNDNRHISYYDASEKQLEYVQWTGSDWLMEPADDGGGNDVGQYSSIALYKASGNVYYPSISYYDATNHKLKYAIKSGGSWTQEEADPGGGNDVGQYSSIAVDSSGTPHISYYDATILKLWYATKSGGIWVQEEVCPACGNDIGQYSSIACDSIGILHISYYDATYAELYYAKRTGPPSNPWVLEPVDRGGGNYVGRYSSIDVDSTGTPHISYYDESNDDLKYAKRTGSPPSNCENNWECEPPGGGSPNDQGRYSSIAVESDGTPHISYYDATDGDLRLAYLDAGPLWITDTVDAGKDDPRIDVGRFTSIALDSGGDEHISYSGDSAYNAGHPSIAVACDDPLKCEVLHTVWVETEVIAGKEFDRIYYRRSSDRGETWDIGEKPISDLHPPIGGERLSASGPAIFAAGATVHVAWSQAYDLVPGLALRERVYYQRSLDGGENWLPNDVAIDDLNPEMLQAGVGYSDVSVYATSQYVNVVWMGNMRQIVYKRALVQDADDSNKWDGSTGEYSSIALDSADRVYIAHFESSYGDLRFSASQEFGWFDTQTVDSDGTVGEHASIDIGPDNVPHMSYYDATANHLKYAVWSGTKWVIETPDSTPDVGQYSSIAVDSTGIPHISYYNAASDKLMYITKTGNPPTWAGPEEADPGGGNDVGQYSSIAVDSNGYSHVSYYDAALHKLKYTTNTGGPPWTPEVVDPLDGDYFGQYSSIALHEASGIVHKHISYYDATNTALRYVYWDGSQWRGLPNVGDRIVDNSGEVGEYTSIALDSSGQHRHISYYDSNDEDLKYAHSSGGTWEIEILDDGENVGKHTSIALDSSGIPHISYYDATNQRLKYLEKDVTLFPVQMDEILSYPWWGEMEGYYSESEFPDISGDGDYLHVVFKDPVKPIGDLKYVEGPGFQPTKADEDGIVGQYTSIALDFSDNEHISYYDATNTALRYVYWDGFQWRGLPNVGDRIVDNSEEVGEYTSIALDSNEYPHISYYDETNTALRYVYWDGSQWRGLPNVGDRIVDNSGEVGEYTSIALYEDSGSYYPCISYYSSTGGQVKYAKYLPIQAQWSIQTVDDGGDPNVVVGKFTSLALDSNDYAHISYYDQENGDLKYRKQTGQSSWANPEVVDARSITGLYTSIVLDPNNNYLPHISYHSFSWGQLLSASFTGSEWKRKYIDGDLNSPVGIWTSNDIGSDEKPQIAYYDLLNGDLKYVKALVGGPDPVYPSPPPPIDPIDSYGDVGLYASLAVDINNNPHISYYDASNDWGIHHRRASINGGGAWTEPNLVSEMEIGRPGEIQLAVNDDNVHVVWTDNRDYTQNGNTHIYYQKSDDNGDTWLGSDIQISDDTSEPNLRNYSPRIAVSGATLEVVWQHAKHPSLVEPPEYCSIMEAINRENGIIGGWGDDVSIAPNPVPNTHWYCAAEPDIAVFGNDRHVIYQYKTRRTFPPPPNQNPDPQVIMYSNQIDTLEPTWSSYPSGGISGTSSVLAYDPDVERDQVFVIGGAPLGIGYSSDVWKYDPETGQSSKECNLLEGVVYTSAVFYRYQGLPEDDNVIYVFFGLTDSGPTDKIYYIDLDDSTCGAMSSGLRPRYGTSAVIDGDLAYVFGGQTDPLAYTDKIVQFNVVSGAANEISVSLPGPRGFTSAVWDESENVAYVVGGETPLYLVDILKFDPQTPSVSTLSNPKLSPGRSRTSAVFDGVYLYVFGGMSSGGPLPGIVRINLNQQLSVGAVDMCPRFMPGLRETSAVLAPSTESRDGAVWIVGGHDGVQPRPEIMRYFPSYYSKIQ